MPGYMIIAWPNGAGKSTFSTILSSPGSLIFDVDKVKAVKEKEWPGIPAESIETMLTVAYWDAEEMAIKGNIDLTVETNLRNDFLVERALAVKIKGYTINLIYMLLPNVKMSSDRVDLRLAQKGHFVDLQRIKFNFEEGLILLKKQFDKFDRVTLITSAFNGNLYLPERLLIVNNHQISYISPNAPSWAQPTIDEIIQKIKTN